MLPGLLKKLHLYATNLPEKKHNATWIMFFSNADNVFEKLHDVD